MSVEWVAPSGGLWELDTVHLQGGQPRLLQDRAPRAFRDGFREAASRYGLPIDYLDVRFVNDHCYARMRPIGGPEPKPGKPSKPPPDRVLRLLARLHPELRRRTRTARRSIAQRRWLDDKRRWEESDRPAMLATGRALQSENLAHLHDEALVDHLRRAGDHLERGIAMHLALVPVHNIPVGRLVRACRTWGFDDGEVFTLLGASSPASTAPTAELTSIAAACAAAGVVPTSLDDVRRAGPEANCALDHFLADHAWRAVTQYSPRGLTLCELPDLLVRAIRSVPAEPPAAPDVEALRHRVPTEQRPRFDELLDDARSCFGVRDDNVTLTFLWPAGLVRRALLECGHRLFLRGLVHAEAHVFALSEDEIAAALTGDPTLAEVAATRTTRLEVAEADGPPAQLGDDEGSPPDPYLFPAPLAELVSAMLLEFELEAAQPRTPRAGAPWSGEGTGIGIVSYSGRACVAVTAEDALARVQPGDVLVTTHTTPTFAAILPIAGAIVTEVGGLMSHTAICSRALAIPAVLGVPGATSSIPDGAFVTVDPPTGRVLVERNPTATTQGGITP